MRASGYRGSAYVQVAAFACTNEELQHCSGKIACLHLALTYLGIHGRVIQHLLVMANL